MSARIIPVAAALCAFAAPATAETPVAEAEPTLGMESGAMQPVMDQAIFGHAIFDQLEGRWNGSNTEFRWDGQGWVGTDYDKLWIKSEGTLQSSGTVDDGQQQFLYSRAVTTYFDLQSPDLLYMVCSPAASEQPLPAKLPIDFLTAPGAARVYKANGMDPAGARNAD